MFPLANNLSPLGISAAAAAVAALNYRDTVLADSPWLYYRLGEASGTTAVDASGNGRDGTYADVGLGRTGAIVGDADTAATPAIINRSYLFNNSTASFEAWLRVENNVGDFGCNDGAGSYDKILSAVYDGNVHFSFYTVSGTSNSPNITFGTGSAPFYHVVGTVDSSIQCLYVNGSLVDSFPAGGSYSGYTRNNVYASVNNGMYADEIAIYTTALSAARVLAHYNAGIGI